VAEKGSCFVSVQERRGAVRINVEYKPEITLLGICGSPRKGNSLFLLEEALETAVKAYPERVEAERDVKIFI